MNSLAPPKAKKQTPQPQPNQKYNENNSEAMTEPHIIMPETDAMGIERLQSWWAWQVAGHRKRLPVGADRRPIWPEWTFRINQKQDLWFIYTLQFNGSVPLCSEWDNATSDIADLKPAWPRWTLADEPPMTQDQMMTLIRVIQDGVDIPETFDENQQGQGKIDWGYCYLYLNIAIGPLD